MRTYLHAFGALTLLLVTSACKKQNSSDYEGEYQSSGQLTEEPVVMYTRSGVEINVQRIEGVLRRRNMLGGRFNLNVGTTPVTAPSYLSSWEMLTLGASTPMKIKVSANHSASISGINSGNTPVAIQGNATQPTRDVLLITQTDSTTLFTSGSEACLALPQKVARYHDGRRWRYIGQAPGSVYSYMCWQKRTFVLYAANGQLTIPMVSCMMSSTNCGYSFSGYSWFAPNDNMASQLLPGDTVVIQKRLLALTKI